MSVQSAIAKFCKAEIELGIATEDLNTEAKGLRESIKALKKDLFDTMMEQKFTCVKLPHAELYMRVKPYKNQLSICEKNIRKALEKIDNLSQLDASQLVQAFVAHLHEITTVVGTYLCFTKSQERKRKRNAAAQEQELTPEMASALQKQKKIIVQPFLEQKSQAVPILEKHLKMQTEQEQRVKLVVNDSECTYKLRCKTSAQRKKKITLKTIPDIALRGIQTLVDAGTTLSVNDLVREIVKEMEKEKMTTAIMQNRVVMEKR
jgi:hypothetical protein